MSREDFVRLTDGVEVAVVYDEWFSDNLPPTWLRVARWTIRDNKSCAFPTVAVYATNPERYPEVLEAVRAFEQELPERRARGRARQRSPVRPRSLAHRRSSGRGDELARGLRRAIPSRADGTVVLPGIGPVVVRGLTAENATAELQKRIDVIPSKIRGTKIVRVTRVALRTPSILVAGALRSPARSPRAPLDARRHDLRAAALAGAGDPARAWLWREDPSAKNGFVKLTRAELAGGALVDGDIVVVP